MSRLKIHLLLVLAGSATCGFAQSSRDFTSLSIPSIRTTNRFPTSNERHLQATATGVLYSNSGFAHGFRHGYERGFQLGDLDLQMGRSPRIALKLKDFQKPSRDYSPDFGSRELFDGGYQAGFHRGYADAISGLEFRVLEQASSAAAGLTEVLAPSRRRYFDEGFEGGFKSSQLKDAPQQLMPRDYLEQYCLKSASGAYALEYCSGFSRGYILGASGLSNATMARTSSTSH